MSMSTYANFALTLSDKDVAKIIRFSLKKFDKDKDAYAVHVGEDASPLLIKITEAFKKETGLDLYIGWNDPDEAERGDDVVGGFWFLDMDEVFAYTPKAKALVKRGIRITRSFYTNCG